MRKVSKVLVMCLADPSGNPRPRRAIGICKRMGLNVDVASYPLNKSLDFESHYLIPRAPKTLIKQLVRFFFKWVVRCGIPNVNIKNYANNYCLGLLKLAKQITADSYNLLIIEDLQLLPVAFKIKGDAKLIFDAREYYPLQNDESILFRLFEKPERVRLCNTYLTLCDKVLTVSPGLVKEYKKEFNINSELIRSVPLYVDCQRTTVNANGIRMVHHGGASRNRQLEKMIEVFSLLDERFTLDFYLVGDDKYINELKKLANPYSNIVFKIPMPFEDIVSTLNHYDIGFYYLEPLSFNVKNCLPNKLFEFIQARLMVAIGPSPDMAKLVVEHQCGKVAESFDIEKMAKMLNSLTVDEIMMYKKNSDIAAKELCFEQEGEKLQNIISRLC